MGKGTIRAALLGAALSIAGLVYMPGLVATLWTM